jgi:hypothetical protein
MMSIMNACTVCKRPIAGMELLYTGQGNPICPQCNARTEVAQLDVRAGKNITSSAISCLVFAVFSYLINPFFIITFISVSAGIYALKSLSADNERFAKHVESQRGLIIALSILGFMLSAVNVGVWLLGFTGPR